MRLFLVWTLFLVGGWIVAQHGGWMLPIGIFLVLLAAEIDGIELESEEDDT